MTSPTIAGDFDGIMRQINQKIQQIEQKIEELFAKINGLLSWVPSFLSSVVDAIKSGINSLNQALQKFWAQIQTFLSNAGSPSALEQAGAVWQNNVGGVASTVSGTVTQDQLQGENDWTGQAATSYRYAIPAQDTALGAIKSIANQIDQSLNKIANAIIAFWIAVGAALAAFIVGLVGAIAACCTVVGTPVGIAEIIGVIVVVLGLLTTAAKEIVTYLNGVNAEQVALGQQLVDNTNFPNGKWPVSAANLGQDDGWKVA